MSLVIFSFYVNMSADHFYLRRRLASGEGIVPLGFRLSRSHAVTLSVCVSVALVSAAKVMGCIQCSLVYMLRPCGCTYPAQTSSKIIFERKPSVKYDILYILTNNPIP